VTLRTVLAVVVSLSQRADGGSWSVAMAVAHAITNGLVLALAMRFGIGARSPVPVSRAGCSPATRWSQRPAWSTRT